MKYLSKCIVDFYVLRSVIQTEEKEAYEYGLTLILNDICIFSLVMIISFLLWEIRYGVEFITAFCVTRIYCGGFHANKAYICKALTTTTFLIVMAMAAYMKSLDVCKVALILSGSFILILPFIPVGHPNKKMTLKQKKKNRTLGIISYLFFSICSYVLWKYISPMDGSVIASSLCAVMALVIIGKLVNYKGVKT